MECQKEMVVPLTSFASAISTADSAAAVSAAAPVLSAAAFSAVLSFCALDAVPLPQPASKPAVIDAASTIDTAFFFIFSPLQTMLHTLSIKRDQSNHKCGAGCYHGAVNSL